MKTKFALILAIAIGAVALVTLIPACSSKSAESKNQASTEQKADVRSKLTPLQYKVTMENGTEPPFRNEYHDNKTAGVYFCIISGKPLFSSKDKFDSGTGWPSFTRPIHQSAVEEIIDQSHGSTRTEVRSVEGKSHLGHVFDDGPAPTGRRYCMNSASLKFVPATKLAEQGHAELAKMFEQQ